MERDERKRHLTARSPDYTHRLAPKKKPRTCSEYADLKGSKHGDRYGVPKAVDLYAYKFIDRDSPNPPRSKSKDGHFRFVNGDNIGSRYKILSLMGEGTFGRVLECWDRHLRVIVAIKVIRSVPKYRDAAMIELEVLNTITKNDPDAKHCCIHLQHWFDYRGHVCIVFEKLGISLYDFMHRNAFRPFPLDVVQHIARQMLHAIVFLHSTNIVHTDLKPENILLKSSEYVKLDKGKSSRLGCRVPLNPDVRVIDFGSATFNDDRHSTVVSTRHYRAPEVILGLGWSFACDIWSAGCIIVELITGRALFQTHENLEHLAMMERVLEKIPTDMARHAVMDARKYFAHDDSLAWFSSASRKSVKAVQQLTSLKRLLKLEADASATAHLDSLYSLLRDMLTYHPSRRKTAHDCLGHHFFRENIRSLLPHQDDEEGEEEGQKRSAAPPEMQAQETRSHPVSRTSRETGETCAGHPAHGDTNAHGEHTDNNVVQVGGCVPSQRDDREGAVAVDSCRVRAAGGGVSLMTRAQRRRHAQVCDASAPEGVGSDRDARVSSRADKDDAALAAVPGEAVETVLTSEHAGGAGALGVTTLSKENGRSRRVQDRERAAVAAKPVLTDCRQKPGHVIDDDGVVLVDAEPSKADTVKCDLEEDAHTSDQAENVRWAHGIAGV